MIKILIGLVLLLAGLGYMYRPNIIIKVNFWIRKNVFNDQMLINHRRRIGMVLIVLGIIAMYMGIT